MLVSTLTGICLPVFWSTRKHLNSNCKCGLSSSPFAPGYKQQITTTVTHYVTSNNNNHYYYLLLLSQLCRTDWAICYLFTCLLHMTLEKMWMNLYEIRRSVNLWAQDKIVYFWAPRPWAGIPRGTNVESKNYLVWHCSRTNNCNKTAQ